MPFSTKFPQGRLYLRKFLLWQELIPAIYGPDSDILSIALAMLKAKNSFFYVSAPKARTKVIIKYIARPDISLLKAVYRITVC